jgi:hypothetical protein
VLPPREPAFVSEHESNSAMVEAHSTFSCAESLPAAFLNESLAASSIEVDDLYFVVSVVE